MARPTKQGLDYYPLDVGFLKDIKFRKIKKSCGAYTAEILINLLGSIYVDDGYYMEWDDDSSFLVADEVGTSEGSINETVVKSLQVDFFNKEIFDKHKILTSSGIQKRYFAAVARRKEIEIIKEILLIDVEKYVNDNINLVYVNINSGNVYTNEQSKVKESKEKKSKEENKDTNVSGKADAVSRIDYQGIIDLYHGICTSYSRVEKLTDNRKTAIQARLRSKYTMGDFEKVFRNAQDSSFLKGANDRNWKADFDWMIKDNNMAKILEDKYADKDKPITQEREQPVVSDGNDLARKIREELESQGITVTDPVGPFG